MPRPSARSIGAHAVPYSCSRVLRASNTEDTGFRELVLLRSHPLSMLAHHWEKKSIRGSRYYPAGRVVDGIGRGQDVIFRKYRSGNEGGGEGEGGGRGKAHMSGVPMSSRFTSERGYKTAPCCFLVFFLFSVLSHGLPDVSFANWH